MRRSNQSALLDLLREEGPLSRAEIARRLQLSPPTVTRIVSVLIESGHTIESATAAADPGSHSAVVPARAQNKVGRRAVLAEYIARSSLIIGITIGGELLAVR